jgi:hypothetical protein
MWMICLLCSCCHVLVASSCTFKIRWNIYSCYFLHIAIFSIYNINAFVTLTRLHTVMSNLRSMSKSDDRPSLLCIAQECNSKFLNYDVHYLFVGSVMVLPSIQLDTSCHDDDLQKIHISPIFFASKLILEVPKKNGITHCMKYSYV